MTKNVSKKKERQYELILEVFADGAWHKTSEIAEKLGVGTTRTKVLLKELVTLNRLLDNGKTKGKMYRLK